VNAGRQHPRRWSPTLLLVAAIAVAATAAPAHAQGLQPWQRHYLRGLELEVRGNYQAATRELGIARKLRPEPRREVDFGAAGRLPYDPYYHLAYCLARIGGSPAVVRRLAERSLHAGITPTARLEELRSYMIEREQRLGHLPGPPPTPVPTDVPTPAPRPTRAHRPATPTPTATPAVGLLRIPELPPEATVAVDGRGYPPGTGEIELPPGDHHLTIAAGSHELYDRTVAVTAGAEVEIVLPPAGIPNPAAAPTPPPHRAPGRYRTAGIAAGALLIVAIVAGVLLLRRRRVASPMEITPTRRLATPPGGLGGHDFGPYLIIDRLGSGGMATTYRAQRVSDGKEVAIKIPHDRCLEDDSFRRRFVREGQLGSQLHHPNIVRIIEAGEVKELPYIAMELVRGTTLRALLAAAGELPLERALDITRQVAEALDYAHSKGVIHRDLKPENLMIQPEGAVLVMDFGIARIAGGPGLTATSVFMGTPSYAAPEAVAKEAVDHRMDLFALGIILFEMLEGAPPFAGANPLEQLQRHLKGDFPTRDELKRALPEAVWALLLRLVARRPEDRFANAEELLVALRGLIRQTEEGTIS